MTNKYTKRSRSTAQRALEIYRQSGEEVMLAFLAVNIPDPDACPWLEYQFHCIFADHSMIARHDEGPVNNHGLQTQAHYHIRWEEDNGDSGSATLNSRIDMNEAPNIPPPAVPVVAQPTTRDIWKHVMETLAANLGKDTQGSQQPVMELHDSHLTAPSLLGEIHKRAVHHQPSPETETALQAEARQLARQIIEDLPHMERQALIDRMRQLPPAPAP